MKCLYKVCAIIYPSLQVLFVMQDEENMNQNIRKLTDGAMMLAIIGAVMLLDRQMAGAVSGTVLYLFPLPMVFYAAKYGFRDSLAVLGALFALLFMLGTPQSIFYVGFEAIIGTVYGAGIHAGTDNRRILIRTILLSVLLEITALFVFAAFFGYDINTELAEYKALFENMMAATGSGLVMTESMDGLLRNVFIISIVLTGILEGLITHFISRMMLKRLHIKMPPSTPLWEYYPPKLSGYLGMAGFAAFYWSLSRPMANELYQNIMQGFGIMGVFYLSAFGFIGLLVVVPRVWPFMRKVIGIIAVLLLMTSAPLMAIFGFLYITTDIHQRVLQGGKSDASENQ